MGRSGSLTRTDSASQVEDHEVIQLGVVRKVFRDHIIINLFNAQVLNLPSKCALESLCENELVQIIVPTPASLSENQAVIKFEKPIFGTIEEVSDKAVRISVEKVNHKRRILTLPRGFLEGFLRGAIEPHAKIRILRGAEREGLYIAYVK